MPFGGRLFSDAADEPWPHIGNKELEVPNK